MLTDRSLKSGWAARARALAVAGLACGLVLAAPVSAQPASPDGRGRAAASSQPVRRGKVVRRPLVNLEQQASGRRPGQVLPGDPPPEKFAPPAAAPEAAPAAAGREPSPPPIPLPVAPSDQDRDAATGQPLRTAPVPVDPEAGPRGAPPPAPTPASTPPAPASAEPPPATPPAAPPAALAEPLDAGVTPVPGSESASAGDEGSPLRAPVVAIDPGAAEPALVRSEPATRTDDGAPAAVRAVSLSPGDVQWRPMEGVWGLPTSGRTDTGQFEVRTGLEGEAVFEIDGRVEVRVLRMSRVRLERRSAESAAPAVLVERGGVELRARTSEPVEVWVRTPDRTAGFASLPGVRIQYSAFSGTSIGRPQRDNP